MSSTVPSDEVAEDFTYALQALTLNSRYEISNLTVIAKENTEHALAISEALKSHIKQTSPLKKLPAFYVLDSIVKNVGTPYTLFFGRQLYATFMEAYALVDNNVRRKMDEMLKTWKEPVPGSIDTRPVFPPEITRPIENALIKARTSAVQAHQEHRRGQQQAMGMARSIASPAPYRNTPTPPSFHQPPPQSMPQGYQGNYSQHQYPPPQQYPNQMTNGQQQYGLPQRPMSQQYPPDHHYQQPPPAQSWQQTAQQVPSHGYGVPQSSIDTLNSDIASLITTARTEFAQNPWDTSVQTRLKAMLDLQSILANQQLPPDQLALIKDQVASLSQSAPQSQAPRIEPPAVHVPSPVPTPVTVAQAPAPQNTLSSLLGSGALAALMARQSATPQPAAASHSAPPIRSPSLAPSQPYGTQPAKPQASTPAPEAGLLERLRAAGILSGTPATSTPVSSGLKIPSGGPPPLPPFLNTPPTAARTPLAEIPNDVVLKPGSLKIPRPHLISQLYERLGEPCTQCGRRFKTDEDGKKKKIAHMDWHFRARQRGIEGERRGHHRSWYLNELDWIQARDISEDQTIKAETDSALDATGSTLPTNKPKVQWIPVPNDSSKAQSVCPICQERFDMKWLDEAQEFVWLDARHVDGRYYHASCYAEVKGTPEPVLGKRKAEQDDLVASRARVKIEH